MSTQSASPEVGPTPPDGGPRRGRGITLAVIVSVQLMAILDSTIVNIALPSIRDDLHFTPVGLSWVLNAYTLAFGGLLLLGGRLADVYGRRRMFVIGVAVFTLASLLGGFAMSPAWLVAFRTLQGVGAAFASPSSLALIMNNFKEGGERNHALAIVASVSGIGLTIGLLLGGALTSGLSWHWVMFVNVPFGVLIMVLAPKYVQEAERHPGRFDLVGALLSTVGMAALVYGFIRAASNGWDDRFVLPTFAVGVVLLVSFVLVQHRAAQPIMPLRLFASRNRAAAYLNMLLLPATLTSVLFFITQFTQDILGYSALVAGCAFLPMAVPQYIAGRMAPRLLAKLGPKLVTVIGTVLITLGVLGFTQITATTSYLGGIVAPLVLVGVGVSLCFTPLNLLILSEAPRQDSGAASGALQTMQRLGGSLGVAILVTVFHMSSQSTSPTLSHQAMAHGIAMAFTVGTVFALCGLAVAVFVIKTKTARA
ncbi:MFS transporter [Actinocrispum wychmicini]|uniref:EmrB/QacA subfamily drug resistance transporter n=1 Tax=Actinocrispum wychmicini TaxID=1213861 RepID=A0A4R2K7I6_9PSEU|nr:MFS transporter [Actinocrispum wychmicini]TCO62315.1 EmrB/QacA subfamily drug resistance transporter [Actinocrispum wychmicini]